MQTKEIIPQFEIYPGHAFGNTPKFVKWSLLVVAFLLSLCGAQSYCSHAGLQ